MRTDHVSNDRPGLRIVKTDMNGVPLENATFTLTESGESVGANAYVSGSDGLVTIAYLNKNTPYTLTETAAPQNYIALMDQITLTIDNNDIVTVGNAPAGDIVTVDYNDPSGMTTVKIKNSPTGFKFEKVTAETDQSGVHTPLSGAHFALYPEVTAYDGTKRKNYYPVTGYDDIVSNATGELPDLINALTPGSYYYLTETQAPANYMQLTGDIRFAINERGELVIDDESYAAWLTTTTENGTLVQTFSIQNERLEQIMIFKKDSKTGTALAGAEFALYAAADFDDSTDTPLADAEPLKTGETGSNGLLPLGNLPRGSYRLVETKAPLGYFAPEHALPIEVTENSITITQNGVTRTATTGTGGTRILDVTNVLAIELPATGGSGPLLIYAGGFFLLLIVGAALIWLRRRRTAEGVSAL